MLRRAAAHRGASFVEILQNCNIYNDGAFDAVREDEENRIYRATASLSASASKELAASVYGTTARGDRRREWGGEGALLVHDEHHPEPSLAFALSRLTLAARGVTPVGVFRDVELPVYEDLLDAQIAEAKVQRGETDLAGLLHTGDTWQVPQPSRRTRGRARTTRAAQI